jgi:site-specific recombinase XerD
MENEITSALGNHDLGEPQHPSIHGLVNSYIHLATSDNTRKAYRHDIRHYESWGGKLPATSDLIARYLEAYAATLNPRTLARRLIAIKHWHTYQGFPDPTTHPAIQKTMSGILRVHGKPKNKARAITPEELKRIHTYLQNKNTFASIRDNALLQTGFFGALRRSELVAIQYQHITWDKAGIEILLPTSKTDQIHEGQYCVIPYGNDTLCPVRTLKYWLEESGIQSGAIFRRITLGDHLGNEALTPLSINQILKKCASAAGITDISAISSHSLRRGLATSAARAGAPLQAIMRAGRWKQTNTVMEYIEASSRFTENAATKVIDLMKTDQRES